MKRRRRVLVRTTTWCLSLLVAPIVAGCGSAGSSGPAGPSTTPASTVPVTVAPTSTAITGTPSATPVASATAPTGVAACPTRSLGAKAGISQGTAGSTYTNIVLTNISTVSCTLYGYPGVAFTAAKAGTQVQVGAAAAHSTAAPRQLVTLAPGAVAHALLQIVDAANYPPSACGLVTADYLQIYPPGQTTPIYLAYRSATCTKPVQILTVGVVQPGAGS